VHNEKANGYGIAQGEDRVDLLVVLAGEIYGDDYQQSQAHHSVCYHDYETGLETCLYVPIALLENLWLSDSVCILHHLLTNKLKNMVTPSKFTLSITRMKRKNDNYIRLNYKHLFIIGSTIHL
jgi:hypothetical protein